MLDHMHDLITQMYMYKETPVFSFIVCKEGIHHFKSDLIINMEHMRISGTEPSSVILS